MQKMKLLYWVRFGCWYLLLQKLATFFFASILVIYHIFIILKSCQHMDKCKPSTVPAMASPAEIRLPY